MSELGRTREAIEDRAWDLGFKSLQLESLEACLQVERHMGSSRPSEKVLLSFKKQYSNAMKEL